MTSKEIGRESTRIFNSLLPSNWVYRSQEDQEDYGVDGEIEITTSSDQASGIIFKVQLKGTRSPRYDSSQKLIFSAASVERFSYYINSLKIPLIFVVCDVINKKCFWINVQGNRFIENSLEKAQKNNQKKFTIILSPSKILTNDEDSTESIIDAVDNSTNAITIKGLKSIGITAFKRQIHNSNDIETTEQKLRLFAGLSACEKIWMMLESGDFYAARKKSEELLKGTTEPICIRILGGISLVDINNQIIKSREFPSNNIESAKFKLSVAQEMLSICRYNRNTENRIKHYVLIYYRASRIMLHSKISETLAMSLNMPETLSRPFIISQWIILSSQVCKDFNKIINILWRIEKNGHYEIIPYAVIEILSGFIPFIRSLRIAGKNALVDAYIEVLFIFISFCSNILNRFEKDEAEKILIKLGILCISLSNITDYTSINEFYNRYKNIFKDIITIDCTKKLSNMIQNLKRDIDKKTPPSTEDIRFYYEQQAANLGVDLNDPQNQFAVLINIGLEDLDPTRIARKCRNIHIISTSYGIVAEMLGLPTAGFKKIICLKHGHSLEGLKLDDIYHQFHKKLLISNDRICCENCSDIAPLPLDWKWSEEYWKQQDLRYQKLLRNYNPTN